MEKLYTVTSVLPIPALDNIVGPMTTPTKFDQQDVLWMLKNGYEVYQHNPFKKSEKVKVTRANINSIKFNGTRESATAERLLNRSIQEMDKPLNTPVIKKNEAQKSQPTQSKQNTAPKKNDTETKEKKDDTKETKVSTPDDFKK